MDKSSVDEVVRQQYAVQNDPLQVSIQIWFNHQFKIRLQAWNVQTSAELSLNGPVGQVYSLAVGNELLFAGVQDGNILAWKYNTVTNCFEPVTALQGHSAAVVTLVVGANRLYSGSMDNSIRVWNLENLQCLHTLTYHTSVVMSVLCWDQFLLSCSLDKTTKVWAATDSGNLEVTYTHSEEHIHSMMWVSVVAAIMSFCYSSIGFGLGITKVVDNGKIDGSIYGVSGVSPHLKLLLTFQALDDIAFAYPYSLVFLEIQDTLKSPPSENKVMKKASVIAIIVTTFFYLGCGCFGYAAFGEDTPGNLLTGFGFYEPYWLIDFANACIILHLIGGYQLVYAYAERRLAEKFSDSRFLKRYYGLQLPFLLDFELNLFRLCFRTSYVVLTIGVAMVFPYFNEILGLLGALNLWPLAIYLPVEMYIVQRKVEAWSRKWVLLQIFSGVLMVISTLALIGSVSGLIEAKIR